MEMQDLESIRPEMDGERYMYNGISVPRVTSIISKTIHEDYLLQWANSLGFKRKGYTKTLNEAADYGTRTHKGLELFLKGEDIPLGTPINPIDGFKQWWALINEGNDVKILGQEQKLVCPWFGGTYDMLLCINGKNYMVDFKTSNHLSYKYCLQLAAYNYIIKHEISLSGIIILQLDKKYPTFNEFVLDFGNPNHAEFFSFCEETFLSLVYSYYHILETEKRYKTLNKVG